MFSLSGATDTRPKAIIMIGSAITIGTGHWADSVTGAG